MIEEQTLLDERYRILEPLGSGGMSEVYLGRDEQLGREVALKVLREQYASDEGFVERFGREARSAASLQHPNIASVYDLGRSRDGRYYIVMEYVRGGTLAEYLGRRGSLPVPTAAEVAEQVASALGAAHAEGVIHRDVKPQNILITKEGNVKLADFGIARAAAATSVSQTGHVLGTARYMSPEQAMGEQTAPQSDLYSLGGVLYEMLTGEVPFEADTPVAISLKHVSERPHHPAQINPEVPEGMDAVVMRLLAKDPAERYESAGDLAEDLGRIRDGLPPVTASAADGLVPAGAPAAVAGDSAAVDDANEALPAATSGKRKPRRRKLLLSFAPLAVVVLLAAILLGLSQGSDEGGVIGSLEGPEDGSGETPLGEAHGIIEDAGQALLGPQEATIPDVEGLSEEQARQSLDERGLGAESRYRQSPEGDAGMVLEQSAPGGQQAEEGSVVLLAVGEGSPAAAGPTEGSGVGSGQASVPDGPKEVGGSYTANSDSGNSDSGNSDLPNSGSANPGGGGSGNVGNSGSNGPPQGSGGYTVPPATDNDEASPDSASTPVGPPETYAPPQTPSQPSPAPAALPEPRETPTSPSPREVMPEPSYQEEPAEPPADTPVPTEEVPQQEPPADPPVEENPAPAVDSLEEILQPAVPAPEDLQPSDEEAIDDPTVDQYE